MGSVEKGDEYSAPYWEGLKQGRILLPRCKTCNFVTLPAGPCCPNCLSDRIEWESASGRGIVLAFVEYHHSFDPAIKLPLPYNVALVRLEEGPTVITNVLVADISHIKNDMPVEAAFDVVDANTTLLKFRPVPA